LKKKKVKVREEEKSVDDRPLEGEKGRSSFSLLRGGKEKGTPGGEKKLGIALLGYKGEQRRLAANAWQKTDEREWY